MKTEVRFSDKDFNELKISASVVLSRALVASSHNLDKNGNFHVIYSKKPAIVSVLLKEIYRSPKE